MTEHLEDEALIAELADHPGTAALRRALVRADEEWMERVANSIRTSPKPLDQRKIDHTRGYFAGAHHWLNDRVTAAKLKTEEERA